MPLASIVRPALLVALAGSLAGCSASWQREPVAFRPAPAHAATSQAAPAQTPATGNAQGAPSWQSGWEAGQGGPIVSAAASNTPPTTDGFPDSPAPARPDFPAPNTAANASGSSDDGLGWYTGTFSEPLADSRPVEDAGGSANISQVTQTFEGSDFDPIVSRDGSFMVFASTQHRPTADIYLKRMGSTVLTQLTSDPAHDMMPSISPDGQWIAFTSNRSGNWDIYVMPIDGGKALQLTTDTAADLHPSWSPDGNSLVFCRYGQTARRWELWVLDMRTPTISFYIGEGLFPEWCPVAGTGSNGSDRILYQRSRERGSRSFGVWTVDYGHGEASNPMLIASGPDQAFINPSWSPDGRWVAFAGVPADAHWSERNTPRPSNADLFLASVEGGNRVRLTSGSSVDLMPTFAPDGTLLFISDRSGTDCVWMMTTREAIQTATGRVPMGQPVFTQAGDEGH